MDRADVIRLALEADPMGKDGRLYSLACLTPETLKRFAALVRAQVIEEAIDVVALFGGSVEIEAALRGMKSDSGHSATADAGASTAPLPEGKAATARELAAMFRQFTKSSHRWHDGRSVHIVAAEVLEHFASTGADTGRHGPNVKAESASPSVLLIRGEK